MTFWPAWVAGMSLLFGLYTAASYFLPAFQWGLLATLQLALVMLIATGTGRVLLRALGLSDVSDSQKTLIGCTLGLGILSLAIFFLAALHILQGWTVSLMLAALWLVGFTELRPIILSLGANRNLLAERPLAAGAILLFLGLVFWMAWVPPHQYDSLVYHLALPRAYLREGGLVALDHLMYSHFPQNGEMLFALALLMKSDLLAQMFMWLATALSVWWIFEAGKREAPLSAVLLSCFLLVTHTSVMLLSSTTYVEPLAMLWTTASVLSFLRWRQLGAADPAQRSWLALSAVFAGLALGTKYYTGITAGLLGLALVLRLPTARREALRARALDLMVFTGLATALFMPWLVKNVLEVGNPVFPFFYRWFPMTGTGWNASSAQGYFNVLTEYGHPGGFWRDLGILPFKLLTDSLRFGGGMDVLGGVGWALTFWFLPVGIWASWRNGFLRALILFCACYMAAWFCTGVVLRFLIVIAPLLCLISGRGIYGLWEILSSRGRLALGAAMVFLTLTHLLLFLFIHAGAFQSGNVLLGLEERRGFLSRRLDYYPCARYAGEQLDKNDKILIVGEQRGYYVEQPHAATAVHSPNPFILWANEASGPAELARRIGKEGFKEILLVPREAERLGTLRGLSPRGRSNWTGLETAYLKELFRGQACALSTLREP